MNKKLSPAAAGLSVSILSVLLLVLTPAKAVAFEPPPFGVGLCFGLGGTEPYFADVLDGVSGTEVIVTNINETVFADTDEDGFRSVRSTVIVRLRDRTGALRWSSPQLKLFSPDLATVLDGGGFFPDSYFLPGFVSDSFAANLFFGGVTCYNTAYAVEAAGQKYLAVVIGFFTQTGDDEATGVDESRANVWILNRNTGAVVHEHTVRKRGGRFLAGITLSGIGKVDGDADDELVVVWAQPFGNGSYKLYYETYNILTGALEENFTFFTSNVRKFN